MGIETALIGAGVAASVGSTVAGAAGAFDADAPEARDLNSEAQTTYNTLYGLAPSIYKSESEYQPKYAQLGAKSVGSAVTGEGGVVPTITRASGTLGTAQNQATRTQRQADVTDLTQYAGNVGTAYRSANPEHTAQMTALYDRTSSDLNADGLTAYEKRIATNAVRQAQSARGFGVGQNDALEEAVALEAYDNNRRQQRIGNALNVAQADSLVDPWNVLGNRSTATAQAASAYGQGSSVYGLSGMRLFDPYNSYASDLYNTNYNAQAAANIASANNSQAAMMGGMSGLSNLAGMGMVAGAQGGWFNGGSAAKTAGNTGSWYNQNQIYQNF